MGKAQSGWRQAGQRERAGKEVSKEADGAAATSSPKGASPLCQASVPQDQKDINQGQAWAGSTGWAEVHSHPGQE